MIDAENRFIPV